MTQQPKSQSVPGGWNLSDLIRDIVLAWRLMGDPQVSGLLKLLLPVMALVYWISPIDLLVGMPFDDIAVILLATRLFVQMAPPDAVERAMFRSGRGRRSGHSNNSDMDSGPVIDGQWRVVDDE
jgi:uncharacterized membrane protein YkvA (DUF1232 family)